LARETFVASEISAYVDLFEGDALEKLVDIDNVAFCFIDCEKEMYEKCWDILSTKIVYNGLIIADSAINHYEIIKPMVEKATNDNRWFFLKVEGHFKGF
jgi:caffeoyl-CoA O-methyltransferase